MSSFIFLFRKNFASNFNKTIFTYVPEELSEGLFDGNEFILKNKANSVKVTDIDEFIKDLDNFEIKKQSVQSKLM